MIYLAGYMACGKSTLGRALQAAYPESVRFVDMDAEIERRAGATIPEIFAARGEEAFRALERALLAELPAMEQADGKTLVVGCGGGTPCQPGNLERMLATGTVVYLHADVDRILSRLADAPGTRPLIDRLPAAARRRYVEQNLAVRQPYYSRAHATFDTTELDTPAAIAAAVQAFAARFSLASPLAY